MTNSEKLVKELSKDAAMFAEVIVNGICDAISSCNECPVGEPGEPGVKDGDWKCI